jgi:hypothetical protein
MYMKVNFVCGNLHGNMCFFLITTLYTTFYAYFYPSSLLASQQYRACRRLLRPWSRLLGFAWTCVRTLVYPAAYLQTACAGKTDRPTWTCVASLIVTSVKQIKLVAMFILHATRLVCVYVNKYEVTVPRGCDVVTACFSSVLIVFIF